MFWTIVLALLFVFVVLPLGYAFLIHLAQEFHTWRREQRYW